MFEINGQNYSDHDIFYGKNLFGTSTKYKFDNLTVDQK